MSDWLESTFNGAMILTLVGVFTGMCSGCLAFILKSRCSTIKLGCIEVKREVLTPDEMKNVQIQMTPNN